MNSKSTIHEAAGNMIDSSVAEVLWFNSRQEAKIFLFSKDSESHLRSNQLGVERVSGFISSDMLAAWR